MDGQMKWECSGEVKVERARGYGPCLGCCETLCKGWIGFRQVGTRVIR